MAYDAGSIESRLDVDILPFKRGLDEAKARGREFERQDYRAKLDVDTQAASGRVLAFRREVQQLEQDLDRVSAKVGGGGRGGGGGLGGGFGRFASGLPNPSLMSLGVGAALPLVPGALGLAAGGAASLLTPTAAGLIGLGGFGAAAKSSITTVQKDVTKLTALTGRYNAAVTDKQRAAVLRQEAALWASLDPAQRNAVRNVQNLDSAWSNFKKKLEPQTFGALAGGAGLARTGLARLFPSSQAAGNAVIGLEKTTNQKLQGPFAKQFFSQFLPSETTRAIDTGGIALQSVAAGVGHMIEKFAPLGHDLENVVIRLSDRFEKWSEGSGPTRFVAWVEREGPPAAKALEGLAHGLEGLGAGFAPIARVELAALTPTLNFIGDLGKQHPEVITAVGTALLTVGAGLKGIALAKGVGSVLSKIPGLGGRGGAGGGGGGGGGVLGAVASPGSSPLHPAYVVVLDKDPGVHLPGGGGGRKLPPFVGGGLRAVGVLGTAYVATSGGDQAPGQGSLVSSEGIVGQHSRANVSASYLASLTRSLPASVQKGIVSDNGSFRVLNTQAAVNAVEKSGTSDQRAALADLAKRYSNVAAAVAKYRQAVREETGQVRSLNQFLVANTGLAKQNAAQHRADVKTVLTSLSVIPGALAQARAQAKRGGISIGQQLDEGLTVGIKQNGGKVNLVSKQLVDGVLHTMHNTAQIGSPSKITTGYGRDIALGLAVGFAGQLPYLQRLFDRGTKAALASVRAATVSRLGSAQQQYSADVSSRAQFAAGLASQYVGGLNLTGAIGAQGQVGNLNSYIGNYAGSVRTLGADLKLLRGKRLSSGLLDMIAQAGPVQGVALAQSILSGHSGSIASLNHNYAALGTYANRAAGQDATAMFAAQIAKDRQMVALLTELVRLAKDNPRAMAGALDTAIRAGKVHH